MNKRKIIFSIILLILCGIVLQKWRAIVKEDNIRFHNEQTLILKNKDRLPPLDNTKYGNIICVWDKTETTKSEELRYIVITDKDVFLEYWKEEDSQWKDLENVKVPNLTQVEEHSYVFSFLRSDTTVEIPPKSCSIKVVTDSVAASSSSTRANTDGTEI